MVVKELKETTSGGGGGGGSLASYFVSVAVSLGAEVIVEIADLYFLVVSPCIWHIRCPV